MKRVCRGLAILSVCLCNLVEGCGKRQTTPIQGRIYESLPVEVKERIKKKVRFPGTDKVEDFYSIPRSTRDTPPLVKKMGIGNLRQWFRFTYDSDSWESFSVSIKRHVETISRLGMTNTLWISCAMDRTYPTKDEEIKAYADYCEYLAQSLRGKVKMYILFGEINARRRLSPEKYVEILRATVPKIKSADPKALVSSCSLHRIDIGYMEQLLELGLADLVDFVSFNPYNVDPPEYKQRNEPERFGRHWRPVLPDEPNSIHGFENEVRTLQKMVRTYSRKIKFDIGEFGWQSNGIREYRNGNMHYVRDVERGEYLQAIYLARRMLMLIDLGVHSVCYFSAADMRENKTHFGIMDFDMNPKPGFYAYETICKVFYSPRELEKPHFRITVKGNKDEIQFHQFLRNDYELLLTLWCLGEDTVDLIIEDSHFLYPVRISLFDYTDISGIPHSIRENRVVIQNVRISQEPTIIRLVKED